MDNNLLMRLYKLAKEMYFSQKYYKRVDSFVILLNNDKNKVNICGCLGPLNGAPVCPCAMYRLLYEYKDVIATNEPKEARDFYHDQPLMSVKDHLHSKYPADEWRWCEIENYLRTEEQVIADAAAQSKKFFAYLIDGECHERGEMGWFACVANEDEDWNKNAIRLFDDIPDDTIVTVVDCHI